MNQRAVLGFTLVELLVVLVIIAVLVMIAIPRYQAHQAKAAKLNLMSQMQSLATRLDMATTVKGVHLLDLDDYQGLSDDGDYQLNAQATGSFWQIVATPISKNAPTFSLDQNGKKCQHQDDKSQCGMGDEWLVQR
ncbi:prepilin-type N-terminal cleavage/methylation domain-containing protein [Moraxella nasovis]|uniref:prepilin-type N-terminal cleavage/methylation domain-containing protein n=1 Tax=Moraxella nasovis TaxID=2904121 RepID=UPI001F609A64|nr:prepilin-type N-terminal cleavage/methylation domain-containing protein [Moraxella nasovis]UNU73739.1 prepilin-type N-terminal cleavage/methylation domain-containing protein [Moraxella nasovis]